MNRSAILCALAALAAGALAHAAIDKNEEIISGDGGDASELIGGTPAKPEDWPASVYARMSGAACSATVVGEKVLLIAAHCVSDGGTASFSAGGPNQYSSRCTHHPDYSFTRWLDDRLLEGIRAKGATEDWALCHVDKVVTGIKYEKVLVDAAQFDCKAGKQVRLTGYGCIRSGGGGGNDGVFRVGLANVTSCPSGANNHDTVTRGASALCYGDSGGGAYLEGADGSRAIFGVNSRGNIRDTSYLSSTYTGKFKSWATTWAASKAVKICGLHADALGCRGANNPPPPPPPPGDDCADELAAAIDTQSKAGLALGALKACMTAIEGGM